SVVCTYGQVITMIVKPNSRFRNGFTVLQNNTINPMLIPQQEMKKSRVRVNCASIDLSH
ncbi:MAG: hypothetical protein RLZZ146_1772, partial [Bacteroidota bacterium]